MRKGKEQNGRLLWQTRQGDSVCALWTKLLLMGPQALTHGVVLHSRIESNVY
jgi:hypothetical protein